MLYYCSALSLLIMSYPIMWSPVLSFGWSDIMPYASPHWLVQSSLSSLLLSGTERTGNWVYRPMGLQVSRSPYLSLPLLTSSTTLLMEQHYYYCTCAAWARTLEIDPLHAPCPCLHPVLHPDWLRAPCHFKGSVPLLELTTSTLQLRADCKQREKKASYILCSQDEDWENGTALYIPSIKN